MASISGNSSVAETSNIVRGTQSQLVAFLVLNVWPSHFGLPVLLAIILLSKKIQRHSTFINLCISFIITGISSSLLLYAGKTSGPEPSQTLCLFQASLLYGMPGLTSTAAFILVLQMFLVIRISYQGKEFVEHEHMIRLWVMLVAPYFAFFICVLATITVGAAYPERISRDRRFFYCSVKSDPLTNTLMTYAAFVLTATFVLEVWTMCILYKRRLALRRQGSSLRTTMELNFPLRIIAFGFYIIIALSLSVLSVKSPESPVPDLVIASAASVVILIFGTQRDIIRVLCFWRAEEPQPSPESDSKIGSISSNTKFFGHRKKESLLQ